METSVKFEYNGYTILADGLVLSPGHVEGIQLTFEGMDNSEVPVSDYRMAKELAREEMITAVYNSELSFS